MIQPPDRDRVYVYLARRDRSSIRLLTVLPGRQMKPTRIDNVTQLGISGTFALKLAETAYKYRMDWEVWAESAQGYEDLRQRVAGRGYESPAHMKPLHTVPAGTLRTSVSRNGGAGRSARS